MTSVLSIFDSSIRFRRVCTRASTRLKSNLAILSSPSKSNFGNLCDQNCSSLPSKFWQRIMWCPKTVQKMEKSYNYLSCFIWNLNFFRKKKVLFFIPKGGLFKSPWWGHFSGTLDSRDNQVEFIFISAQCE